MAVATVLFVILSFIFASFLSKSSADELLEGIDLDVLVYDSTPVSDPGPSNHNHDYRISL